MCPTLAKPWTVARQASRSMGFSRQKYWSGQFLLQGLPDLGIELRSPDLIYRAGIDTDMENKCMDTKAGGRGGINWEMGVDTFTLLCVCLLLSHV